MWASRRLSSKIANRVQSKLYASIKMIKILTIFVEFFSGVLPKLRQDEITPEQKLEMLVYFLGVRALLLYIAILANNAMRPLKEKANATNYNKELQNDEIEAEKMAKDFEQVQTDVAAFRGRFEVYFKSAEQQLQKEVTDLQGKVAQLETKLASLKKWVRRLVLSVCLLFY
jgi:hypothetical protein